MTMFSTLPFSKYSGKIPLRVLVIIPFILQIITVVGLTAYVTFSNGQKTIQVLVNPLQREISATIQQHLKTSLTIPLSIVQINTDAIERGELSFQDITSWHHHFIEQIQLSKSLNYPINYLYVTSEAGPFISIKRLEDDSLRQTIIDETGSLQEYALNKKGTVINKTKTIPHFTWKIAPQYPSRPGWSDTSNDIQGDQLAKIFNYPYFSSYSERYSPTSLSLTKSLQGILGIGISLKELSNFLSTLKIGQSGIAFIVERSGSLIATSSSKNYPLEAHNQKIPFVKSQDALIQATVQHLKQHVHYFNDFDTEHQGHFSFHGQRHFLQLTLFKDHFGLEWFIVVVIPETDFTEHLKASLYFTLFFSFVVLILAISFMMFISHWLVQPILSLNLAAKYLTQKEWQKVKQEARMKNSFFTPLEWLELHQSFEQMTQELQKSFVTLQTHEEKYRALFDSAHDAVILIKEDQIIDCNTKALAIFGFMSKEEIMAQSPMTLFPSLQSNGQNSQELMREKLQESLMGGPLCFEWTYKRNDATLFESEVILRRVELEEHCCVQAIIRDVTERKYIETERLRLMQKLKDSEEYWRIITETVLVGITITRLSDGKFIYANEQIRTILGLSPEQIIHRTSMEFYQSPKERKKILKAFFRHHGYLKNYELQIKKADNSLLWVSMFMRFLTFNNEKLILTVFYDITEHKRIEEEKIFLIKELEEMNITFTQLNSAYERFVPHEFLSYLNKENVVEVNLGDQIERDMTILFSDIRDFTSISEKLSPLENFEFINLYLGQMEPIIREHHGFIDKYIGDAIMALFPSADHAVKGATSMLRQLRKYNSLLQSAGLQPISIGIGLNTGRLMLGTVGSPHRMEGTVISDAVNLASRIEGLTKAYHSPLLITEYTYQKLHQVSDYRIRIIDRVVVKGKTQEVTIYEVFDADLPWIRKLKLRTLFHFEQGVHCFHHKQFEKAKTYFEKVLHFNEGDLVAQKYLIECQRHLGCIIN